MHFGPRLLAFAAFQKMICGVSYERPPGIRADAGFPRGALHIVSCHAASCPACQAIVYADETGWKQGGRRVWLWVFTNLRETVYEILPGRGFEQAASVLGNRGRRLGPLPLLQGSDATDLLQPSAAPLPRYWRRPRAGRCASHAWSRPSSGTPSPCAITAPSPVRTSMRRYPTLRRPFSGNVDLRSVLVVASTSTLPDNTPVPLVNPER